MKTVSHFSIAIFLIAVILSSCKKDKPCTDNGLPCLTTEGKNTFGCLIDGVPFVAKTSYSIGGAEALSGTFDEITRLFKIQANRENSEEHLEKVNFQVYVTNGNAVYVMKVSTSNYDGYTDYSGQHCEYFHDQANKGKVGIAFLDEENNIISGTFSMTLVNPSCMNETMVITNGRFDFGY